VLYCDTCPCLTCSIKICQVGISEVVYAHGYSMDTEAAAVFMQAGVKLRQFIPVSLCPVQTKCVICHGVCLHFARHFVRKVTCTADMSNTATQRTYSS
jgi:hypothetical protein